jgi:hypothetical protein
MSQLLPIVGPASLETNSLITIQKAKLKDSHLTCEFTEQRTAEAPARAFVLTSAELAHPDLLHAFSRLVPHLCLMAEQLTEAADYWPSDDEELPARFASFTVTGFSLGKNQSGITLTGQRELAGGKVLNLTSPYQSFDDEQATYAYSGLLEATLATALTEVEAALRGKCSEYRQLDLFEQPAPNHTLLVPAPLQA